MANYLLDTNIIILALRGVPQALNFLDTLNQTQEQSYISVVTRTEILAGMRPHEEERTMTLLESLASILVNEVIADQAGRLIYQYARQGVQLSLPDAQIAATALHYNLTLVTTNTKHFPMPQLTLHTL
ncbi:MAG: type II toxin-antitoxin system VapC family toxin [Anaerolineales bacterium]|nr:type II toxin-antitoxin system VapC family toxin [Anaerolineales bacterium]